MMGGEGVAKIDRRGLLTGLGAAALLAPSPAWADPAADAIAAMIARGEARDAALRRAFPFGKADGTSPYVTSQRHGAWLDLAAPDAARRLDAETPRLPSPAPRGLVPPPFLLHAPLAAPRPPPSAPARRQPAAPGGPRSQGGPGPGAWGVPG